MNFVFGVGPPNIVVANLKLKLEIAISAEPQPVSRVRKLEWGAGGNPLIELDRRRFAIRQIKRQLTPAKMNLQLDGISMVDDARILGVVDPRSTPIARILTR